MPQAAMAICPACGAMLEYQTEWITTPKLWDKEMHKLMLLMWCMSHLDIPDERWIDIEIKCPECGFNKEGRVYIANPTPKEMMTLCRMSGCKRAVIDSYIADRLPYMCPEHDLNGVIMSVEFHELMEFPLKCINCHKPLIISQEHLEAFRLCNPKRKEDAKAVYVCALCNPLAFPTKYNCQVEYHTLKIDILSQFRRYR